jgi:hypothetical protein
MSQANDLQNAPFKSKNIIAYSITALAICGTIYIAIMAFSMDGSAASMEKLKFLATTMLPLWGTWMGTILAFYFARENFEAAQKSVNQMVDKLSPAQKLESIRASEVMVPFAKMKVLSLDEYRNKSILNDILKNPLFEGINHFPIIKGNICQSIVHRSILDAFIVKRISNTQLDVSQLTLHDFLTENSDRILVNYLLNGVAYVKAGGTLLESKLAMEKTTGCQDAIITATGNANEDIIGWITNIIVANNSRVD